MNTDDTSLFANAVTKVIETNSTVNRVITKSILYNGHTHLIWTFLFLVGLREGIEFTYEFPTRDTIKFKVLGVDVPAIIYKGDSYLQWNKIPGMKEPRQRADGGWDFIMPKLIPKPGEITILGTSIAKEEQLFGHLKIVNTDFPQELPLLYLQFGQKYGIRGDIAFAQMIKETGYFRFEGVVKREQNNFAGIGAVGGGQAGASFPSVTDGVRAHIQHLYAYASTKPIPSGEPLIDPRFNLVARGSATTWIVLNGRWAVPGTNYGQEILAIYQKIIETPLPANDYTGHWAEQDIKRVIAAGIMVGDGMGKFRPDEPLTRAEMARILTRLMDQGKI